MMEEALRTALAGDGTVAALAGTRIHWSERPQGSVLPTIVLHRIAGGRDYHGAGASGLVRSLVQVDCWAATYTDAKALARATAAAVSGLASTISGTELQGVFIRSERDMAPEPGGGAERYHRVSLDLEIWHDE